MRLEGTLNSNAPLFSDAQPQAPKPDPQPSEVTADQEGDWRVLLETERVYVSGTRISGSGRIDTVMPDGSAVWVWLDNGMGRVLLIAGEDRLLRLEDDPGP